MNLPDNFKVLVITLSDRAFSGEYNDLSGPAVKERLIEFFHSAGWAADFTMDLIPDDTVRLRDILMDASQNYNIIITTGGTGIGPNDITPDTVRPLLSKEIPGIMEFIRMRYGSEKPNALLSRSVAGIIGKSLIFTLPGSVKAVDEYMTEILKTLKHAILMQHGIDAHGKHQ
jgi:molybdenum cofactor synthesis domain-containing protein